MKMALARMDMKIICILCFNFLLSADAQDSSDVVQTNGANCSDFERTNCITCLSLGEMDMDTSTIYFGLNCYWCQETGACRQIQVDVNTLYSSTVEDIECPMLDYYYASCSVDTRLLFAVASITSIFFCLIVVAVISLIICIVIYQIRKGILSKNLKWMLHKGTQTGGIHVEAERMRKARERERMQAQLERERRHSGQIRLERMQSGRILEERSQSGQVEVERMQSGRILGERSQSGQVDVERRQSGHRRQSGQVDVERRQSGHRRQSGQIDFEVERRQSGERRQSRQSGQVQVEMRQSIGERMQSGQIIMPGPLVPLRPMPRPGEMMMHRASSEEDEEEFAPGWG